MRIIANLPRSALNLLLTSSLISQTRHLDTLLACLQRNGKSDEAETIFTASLCPQKFHLFLFALTHDIDPTLMKR